MATRCLSTLRAPPRQRTAATKEAARDCCDMPVQSPSVHDNPRAEGPNRLGELPDRDSSQDRVFTTDRAVLRAELAGLHNAPLTGVITAVLDELEQRPLPSSQRAGTPLSQAARRRSRASGPLRRQRAARSAGGISQALGVPLIEWPFSRSTESQACARLSMAATFHRAALTASEGRRPRSAPLTCAPDGAADSPRRPTSAATRRVSRP